MARLVVIADDLTGANANGVQLTGKGFSAETVLGELSPDKAAQKEPDALLIPTSSRALPADEAYALVHDAVNKVKDAAIDLYSKRVDSTLRGNLGSETDAFLDALGDDRLAVVAPCFASAGRTLVGGFLLVNGIPLDRTEAASDPKTPVHTADAAELFRVQSKRAVANLDLNDLRESTDSVSLKIRRAYEGGARILLIDCIDDLDLAKIADAVMLSKVPFIAVDPGVFTATLAAKMIAPEKVQVARKHRVLALIGSVNPVAAGQVEALIEKRAPLTVEINTRALLDKERRSKEIDRVVAEASMVEGDTILVVGDGIDPDKRIDLSSFDKKSEWELSASELINEGFAEIGKRLIESDLEIEGLMTTGGDITVATYRFLGGEGLALQAEIVPLGSFGHLIGGPFEGLSVITKGGMVGDKDALVTCVDHLMKQPARTPGA
jgi:uncharacterized protein YgbK (DUF1537 family)